MLRVPHNYRINPNWIWNIRSLLPRVLFFCKQHMHEYLNHPIMVLTHIFLIVFIYLFMLTIKSRSPFTQHICIRVDHEYVSFVVVTIPWGSPDSFFFNNNIFLFKMLVTFLLQKPKLLMKYFILIFSYIIKILSNNII